MFYRSIIAVSIVGVVACSAEPTTGLVEPHVASLAKGGGSATSATITAAGDIAPVTTTTGAAVTTPVNAKAPFRNLTLSAVQVTLSAPTAPEAACKLAGSSRTYSDSFGNNAGSWQGELVIWQGRTTQQSNFRFSGSRVVDGVAETIQFTANDEDAVQTASGSSVTLTMESVRMGFGSASTHHDLDAAGLPVLRCVQVTFEAVSG